jgi:hypothetical protein
MKRKWFWRGLVGSVVLASLAVTGGVAVATTLITNQYLDTDGKYHGCVVKKDGVLRVVVPGESCRKGEDAIDWNQIGPPGPPGSPKQFFTRFGTLEFVAPGADTSPHALCAPGEQAVAGQFSGNRGLELVASLPVRSFPDLAPADDGDVAIGWRYTFTNTGTETVSVHARVICASNAS